VPSTRSRGGRPDPGPRPGVAIGGTPIGSAMGDSMVGPWRRFRRSVRRGHSPLQIRGTAHRRTQRLRHRRRPSNCRSRRDWQYCRRLVPPGLLHGGVTSRHRIVQKTPATGQGNRSAADFEVTVDRPLCVQALRAPKVPSTARPISRWSMIPEVPYCPTPRAMRAIRVDALRLGRREAPSRTAFGCDPESGDLR
jgi:hypothetical protein